MGLGKHDGPIGSFLAWDTGIDHLLTELSAPCVEFMLKKDTWPTHLYIEF